MLDTRSCTESESQAFASTFELVPMFITERKQRMCFRKLLNPLLLRFIEEKESRHVYHKDIKLDVGVRECFSFLCLV